MPGPPPKPTGRQRRNPRTATERAGVGELALVQSDAPEIPAPPAGLLAVTRDRWRVLWESPLAGRLIMQTDLPALERLWTLYDERERALVGYRKQRLVEGSTGQPTLNPLAKAMSTFDAEIRALEDRFGLTPMARLRLGITFGDATRSLEELNSGLDDDPAAGAGAGVDDDPRLRALDTGS